MTHFMSLTQERVLTPWVPSVWYKHYGIDAHDGRSHVMHWRMCFPLEAHWWTVAWYREMVKKLLFRGIREWNFLLYIVVCISEGLLFEASLYSLVLCI